LSASGARLRTLLADIGLIVAPGAFDAYTARIIQSLGFPAVYLGGNALGLGLCVGQPLVTLTETAEAAARVLRAIDVPLILDAGAGFGDPAHTYRTVRDLERLGAAAIHVDDQVYPKRAHYHKGQGRLVNLPRALDRYHAALDARVDPAFVLIARTDCFRSTGSLDETVARCAAYAEAGVDLLLVLDLPMSGLAALASAVPTVPVGTFVGYDGTGPSTSDLERAGLKLALYPLNTAIAITESVTATWAHLRDTGIVDQPSPLIRERRASMQETIGMARYFEIEARTTERS